MKLYGGKPRNAGQRSQKLLSQANKKAAISCKANKKVASSWVKLIERREEMTPISITVKTARFINLRKIFSRNLKRASTTHETGT